MTRAADRFARERMHLGELAALLAVDENTAQIWAESHRLGPGRADRGGQHYDRAFSLLEIGIETDDAALIARALELRPLAVAVDPTFERYLARKKEQP